MKISKIIQNLEKVMSDYKEKYTEIKDPEIYSIERDEGILICSKVIKDGCLTRAVKPYIRRKIGIEKLL